MSEHEPIDTAVSRRDFVRLLAAGLALAGLDGCTRMPASNILPYVTQPELTPGMPLYFATSMVVDGFATGLLVESHEGRPTKIEGHPDHPASLGAAGVREQASILQLYDPNRAMRVRHGSSVSTWQELAAAFAPSRLRSRLGAGGSGLFLLLHPTSSPLERELLDRVRERYPAARIHVHSPISPWNDASLVQYDFSTADVIVAVDADVLASGPFHLRYARQFSERRRPESAAPGMNRSYVIECAPSPTGAAADHRIAMRPAEMTAALERLLSAVTGAAGSTATSGDVMAAMAADLRAHRGRSVVIAGPCLPPRARLLAARINEALANVGHTVWFAKSPLLGAGDTTMSFAALVDALEAKAVTTLVCIGGNASYASPGAHQLGSLIRRVPESLYFGMYDNETARDCRWMAPEAHYLESWGDARGYDGTLSLVQPLVRPLGDQRTASELLSLLAGGPDALGYDLLRDSWRSQGTAGSGADFESGWRDALSRGFVDATAFARETSMPAAAAGAQSAPQPEPSTGIDIAFRPHPHLHDGSFANNAWLQELPDPITTLTWGNAAQISPATAQRFGIVTGDVIDLAAGGRTMRVPALLVDGHADDAVTVHFGFGRDGAEEVARGVGVNVYPFWPGGEFAIHGATVSRAPGLPRHEFALTQAHHTLETSDAARALTIAEFVRLKPGPRSKPATFYEAPVSLPDPPAPQQWAMTIDLGACTGCGACMVACQAENNVPVVGRDQVRLGREMHWLRIDWYAASPGLPALRRQPMLCQQCEKAPCEYVCPVEATVHSRDGLNEMVYNRCVGTRFCSNNCPYKVRRFNWYDYNARLGATERLAKNPDVTVRERGVMEKCTFCVQRIREAEIAARVDGRPLRGTDVKTACQQTCPTRAIVFGSLTEPESELGRNRGSARAYSVLDDLGTEPRVRYLAAVRNPHPDLERDR